jgi:hypothetical protein
MPIEIRELVIRATVADSAAADGDKLELLLVRLKAQLLEECLSKVEERLGNANER